MILLQEAETHFHEIAEAAAEQIHVYWGADEVIHFHKNTFAHDGQVYVREDAQARKMYVHAHLCPREQHVREQAINCKTAFVPIQESCRLKRRGRLSRLLPTVNAKRRS